MLSLVCYFKLFKVFTKLAIFFHLSFSHTVLPYTQVLTLYNSVSEIDVDGVVHFVASLQQPDGSFIGNKWG